MPARVNLLPWRQRRRERERRVFFAELGGVAAVATVAMLGAGVVLGGRVETQHTRNEGLIANIAAIETRVDGIETLRQRTADTVAHIHALTTLHRERTRTVHILEEIARTIAPGIHYTSLVKQDGVITARGVSGSNHDISALMRKLKESDLFEAPRLRGIEDTGEQQLPTGIFELTFTPLAQQEHDGG